MIRRRIRNRQSRILASYIVSLVALILVPLLLLDIIFLSNGLHRTESAYVDSQEYTLRQAIQSMDDDMKSYRLVASQIAIDSDITPYIFHINTYDTVLAIRKLAAYHAQVSFFEDLYLYVNGDKDIYSGNGMSSMNTFMRHSYHFADEDSEEEFQRFLEEGLSFALSINGNGGAPVKNYDSKRYIAVTYPWTGARGHSIGTLVGMVDVNYFEDILDISNENYQENIYLFDAAGKLQVGLENGPRLSESTTQQLLHSYGNPGVYTGRVDGISCFVITGEAQTTRWKYMAVIPRPQFFLKYVRSESRVVVGITGLLILCILFGIVLAFRMYRPIKELWNILEHFAPIKRDVLQDMGAEMVRRGEWDRLHTSVTKMAEMNKNVTRELEENKELYCQSLLKALVLGAVNAEHVRETLEIQEIVFREEYYSVAVLYCIAPVRTSPAESVRALIEKQKIPGLYVLQIENSGCLTLLWNTPSWDEAEEEKLRKLYQAVTEKTELEWLFGVGDSYQDFNGISHSYAEALAVGESMREKNKPGIYYYGEFRKARESNELYQDILAYVDGHYDDSDISLSGVAEKFGLSTSYLSRFFRKCSGMNFLEYVMDRRIKKACCLLRDTDLKIKDIVEQVGYFDVASFTKKFRNAMGVSPAKYREQIRQKEEERK